MLRPHLPAQSCGSPACRSLSYLGQVLSAPCSEQSVAHQSERALKMSSEFPWSSELNPARCRLSRVHRDPSPAWERPVETERMKMFVAPWSENVLTASCGNNFAPVSTPSPPAQPCLLISHLSHNRFPHLLTEDPQEGPPPQSLSRMPSCLYLDSCGIGCETLGGSTQQEAL